MTAAKPRIFYGWWIVATAALGNCLSAPPIFVYSFGVFLKALTQDFHTGRGPISVAFTLFNTAAAACAPLSGWLIDRFGVRRVVLTGTFLFCMVLGSGKFLPSTLWPFYVFYALCGAISTAIGPVPYGNLISRWFDRRRGAALGLMTIGLGLGTMLMPSLSQRLIAVFGWRTTYAVLGAIIFVIATPILAAFLKERPETLGLSPDGAAPSVGSSSRSADALGLTWREARRTSTFWLMLTAFFLLAATVHACVLHTAAIMTDLGSTPQAAALATSLIGIAVMVGRVGSGFLLDHFFGPRLAAVIFSGVALGTALLWFAHSPVLGFAGAFLAAFGMGAEIDFIAYLTTRYFGLRAFGQIYGYAFAAFALAGGLGPYLMGAGFDRFGSYRIPLAGFFAATVIAVWLLLRLGPYRYLAHASDQNGLALELHPEDAE